MSRCNVEPLPQLLLLLLLLDPRSSSPAVSLYLCVTGAFSTASPPNFNCEPGSRLLDFTCNATDLRHLFCPCSWPGSSPFSFCVFFFLAATIIFINSQSQKSPARHQKTQRAKGSRKTEPNGLRGEG